jgi:hypothetical protein
MTTNIMEIDMEVGQTITQNDINRKLFEEIENVRIESEKRIEKFEREQRESSQKFESRIYAQMNWSLAIFTVIMVGVLSKLIMH